MNTDIHALRSEVFSLRREMKPDLHEILTSQSVPSEQLDGVRKQLFKTLKLARTVIKQDRENEWSLRAYGWTMIDCINFTMAEGRKEAALKLFQDIDGYSIPTSEVPLKNSLNKIRSILIENRPDPSTSPELMKAADLSSRGQHLEGCHLYEQVIQHFSYSKSVNLKYAWEITRALKRLCNEKKIDGSRVHALLMNYANLAHIPKPGQLHTIIMNYAIKASEGIPNFISFVRWWDLSNLIAENYQKYKPAGSDIQYNSLVERLIKELHKYAMKSANENDITFALVFIESSLNHFEDNLWLLYYAAQLNVKLGHHEVARKLLIPVVRSQMKAPWAWEQLGETFDAIDLDTQIACCCRALLCPNTKPEFVVKIHQKLGNLLRQNGMLEQAKYELTTSMAIREKNGWKVPDALRLAYKDNALDGVDAMADNQDLYRKYAPLTEKLIHADLPWTAANISGKSTADDAKKEWLYLVYKKQDGKRGDGKINRFHKTDYFAHVALETLKVKAHHYPELTELPPGSPVQIKTVTVNGRSQILAGESREGAVWDQSPELVGIVDHINSGKQLTFVIFNDNNASCCLYHNRFPMAADLVPGDFVAVKYLIKPGTKPNHIHSTIGRGLLESTTKQIFQPLAVTISSRPPSGSFWETYCDTIRVIQDGRYGFVEDIYIPSHLITPDIHNGDIVSGITIYQCHQKKRKHTWKALTLKKEFK